MYKSGSNRKTLVGMGTSVFTRKAPYEVSLELVLSKFLYPFAANDYKTVKANLRSEMFKSIITNLGIYRGYMSALIGIESLKLIQFGTNLIDDNVGQSQLITTLRAELKDKYNPVNAQITTQLTADVVVDSVYIRYIVKYGVPPNGVFDPYLLSTLADYNKRIENP